jgi:hypothetical protein
MTIEMYAKARMVTYTQAYRAVVRAGIKRGAPRKPTDLTPDDIRRIDPLLFEERKPGRKPLPDLKMIAEQFEAQRIEWLERWGAALFHATDPVQLDDLLVGLGAITYVKDNLGWLDQELDPGYRKGDAVAETVNRQNVDVEPDGSTSGFSAWLASKGYKGKQ